jgi:hypothetical protein
MMTTIRRILMHSMAMTKRGSISTDQDELRHDWELARKQQKPEKIAPLN